MNGAILQRGVNTGGRIVTNLIVTGLGLLCLSGCVSPEEQRAQDQSRCMGYGFQPGTDSFAHCMMQTDIRRENKAEAEKDRRLSDETLSRSRNGNTNYEVCGATSTDSHLDIETGKWAGSNCRQE